MGGVGGGENGRAVAQSLSLSGRDGRGPVSACYHRAASFSLSLSLSPLSLTSWSRQCVSQALVLYLQLWWRSTKTGKEFTFSFWFSIAIVDFTILLLSFVLLSLSRFVYMIQHTLTVRGLLYHCCY